MEYDDGIPMGDLSPPDRLRNVIWDRTAWNRVQWVKLARNYFKLDYKPDIHADDLKCLVIKHCSDWEEQNERRSA